MRVVKSNQPKEEKASFLPLCQARCTNERDFAQRRKMKGRKIKLFKFRACVFPHPLLYEVEGGRGGGGRVVVLLGHRVVHALLDHPLEKREK